MRRGLTAAYRAVAELPGEPHVDAPPVAEVIACFAHLTDLHVTDAQSPGRFEFLNSEWRDPRYRELLTMQRPQEMLNTHAVAAIVRAINRVERGPVTGATVQLVATTGDAIDNTQRNELANAHALLEGGVVHPDSGRTGYDGVQHVDWPGDLFWKPDGPPDGDPFQSQLGFPRHPGLLDQAVAPFRSEGLRAPWLACHGNHEYVCQGVGLVNPVLARVMTGPRKPVGAPAGIDPDVAVEAFVQHPELFALGESREVAADADRRPIRREELLPQPYYVHDTDRVRFITLDTVCYRGGAEGSVDAAQLRWLEGRIEDAGRRHIVVLSHHSSDRLSNPRGEQNAGALLGLLSSSRNVVLWLNGHIHMNRIKQHEGFWEVTTASIVDWPSQARLVEIFQTPDGRVAIATTMIDHDGDGLAGLHRELAGNAWMYYGFDSSSSGGPGDRNAILPV